MAATSIPRATPKYGDEGGKYEFGLKANEIIYAGTLVCLDASGRAVAGAVATGLVPVGRACSTVDATGASDNVKRIEVEGGIFGWLNATAGDAIGTTELGETVYVLDNQTVAKTDGGATRSAAGKVVRIEDGLIYVQHGFGF